MREFFIEAADEPRAGQIVRNHLGKKLGELEAALRAQLGTSPLKEVVDQLEATRIRTSHLLMIQVVEESERIVFAGPAQ